MSWERIDDVLTRDGIAKLKTKLQSGDKPVLMFQYENSPVHLRIMRITKDNKVWAKRTHLYTDEEMKKEVTVVDT